MASVTYFAVLPFAQNDEGELCPAEAVECPTAAAAIATAMEVAATKGGAVAFSRTGDQDTGEYADAAILLRVGGVPSDLEAVSGA